MESHLRRKSFGNWSQVPAECEVKAPIQIIVELPNSATFHQCTVKPGAKPIFVWSTNSAHDFQAFLTQKPTAADANEFQYINARFRPYYISYDTIYCRIIVPVRLIYCTVNHTSEELTTDLRLIVR